MLRLLRRSLAGKVKKGSLEYRMQMDRLKAESMRDAQQKKLEEHLQVKVPTHVKRIVVISFLPGLLGAAGLFFSDYLTPAYRRCVRSIQYWLGLNTAFVGGSLLGLEAMRYHPLAYRNARGLFIGRGRVLVGVTAMLPPLYLMSLADPESWVGIFWYTLGSALLALYAMGQASRGLCPAWLSFIHIPIFINSGVIGMLLAYSLISKGLYITQMEKLHEQLASGTYQDKP